MSLRNTSERGDTLVEALVALAVLAVVVVGSLSLMNKGVAQMYDNMERSEVRQLIEGQVELLNYARDQYLNKDSSGVDSAAVSTWRGIKTTLSSVLTIPSLNNCTDATSAFYIAGGAGSNVNLSTVVTHATASGFPANGDGIWIQKISAPGSPVPYTDFYIRACWMQNSSPVVQVESSVVRLYDK